MDPDHEKDVCHESTVQVTAPIGLSALALPSGRNFFDCLMTFINFFSVIIGETSGNIEKLLIPTSTDPLITTDNNITSSRDRNN